MFLLECKVHWVVVRLENVPFEIGHFGTPEELWCEYVSSLNVINKLKTIVWIEGCHLLFMTFLLAFASVREYTFHISKLTWIAT